MSVQNLRRIKIEGYKSIKSLDLEINPINILIGANGSGKSNFISLFSFMQNLSLGKLKTHIAISGANSFFHFGVKHTDNIMLEFDIAKNYYHVDFIYGDNDDLIFKDEYCGFEGRKVDKENKFPIYSRNGESGLLPDANAASKPVRDHTRTYLEKCKVYHFHDTSRKAGFKQNSKIINTDSLYQDAKNIAPFLYMLKNDYPKNYNEIVECIRVVAPFFHDFYLNPTGKDGDENIILKWLHINSENNEPFSANQLSDGTARFICLATLFLQPQDLITDTIIIDEPELGLHPAALAILAELIQSASKNNQVICSTQSVEFANCFEPEDFIVVDQEKGVSTFKRQNSKELEVWLEDYGMGDIWAKNIIGGRPEW